MKTKFKLVAFSIALLFLASSTTFAAKKFRFDVADTFVFDPFGIGGGSAEWLNGIGLGDNPNCRTNYGLLLEKSAATETALAVGAAVAGLSGAVVTDDDTLGYDISSDSPCLAGSPRFNVAYTLPDGTEGFSFVGGCLNGTITQSQQDPNWYRATFDLQSQAFPEIPVGSTIESVVLIVDDMGTYRLDNIQFRDRYFDEPGSNPGPAPRCSL